MGSTNTPKFTAQLRTYTHESGHDTKAYPPDPEVELIQTLGTVRREAPGGPILLSVDMNAV
jgi:hypothetical protein